MGLLQGPRTIRASGVRSPPTRLVRGRAVSHHLQRPVILRKRVSARLEGIAASALIFGEREGALLTRRKSRNGHPSSFAALNKSGSWARSRL